MSLSGLTLDAIPILDLPAVDEADAIRRTAQLLEGHSAVTDFPGFLKAVFDRQKINPPILGNGVAMPHARTTLIREIVCVAARCAEPMAFGPEKTPVRLVFLFGIPPQRITEYLGMTAALVKRLRNPEILDGLLSAGTGEDFAAWLE